MREMIELGWLTGLTFLDGREFTIEDITNIYFKSPVEIGSCLEIVATVTYVEQLISIISVEAFKIDFSNNKPCEKTKGCELQMVLRNKGSFAKRVRPETYIEALDYLKSKNIVKNLFYV